MKDLLIFVCLVNLIFSDKLLNSTFSSNSSNSTKVDIEVLNLEELNKIKYIIEFSKKNDILNRIYENKGNVTLTDIFEKQNRPVIMEKDIIIANLITNLNSNIIYLSKKISNQDEQIKKLSTTIENLIKANSSQEQLNSKLSNNIENLIKANLSQEQIHAKLSNSIENLIKESISQEQIHAKQSITIEKESINLEHERKTEILKKECEITNEKVKSVISNQAKLNNLYQVPYNNYNEMEEIISTMKNNLK